MRVEVAGAGRGHKGGAEVVNRSMTEEKEITIVIILAWSPTTTQPATTRDQAENRSFLIKYSAGDFNGQKMG